jgi:hypothetical protein
MLNINLVPMTYLRLLLLFTLMIFIAAPVLGQGAVNKTNPMPVYMHYMPWFDTPQSIGQWGWHWKMNNKNPDNIDATTGKREIASHFYPLIGPYASKDPDVLEYHFLLMKYAGIDGILLDWYGQKGSNGDIGSLLTNSNAAVKAVEQTGLKFAVVLEDRFATSIEDVKANVKYLHQNYFVKPEYITVGSSPLLAVFGPINYQTPAQWTEILAASSKDIEFLPLWFESKDGGNNADGEYAWVWEDDTKNNYLTHLETYYMNTAPNLKTVMGVAYPGFLDYYKEGNSGNGYFEIPHEDGATLEKTLALAEKHKTKFDMLQLATWNDFGEGTIFEPTFEAGFSYLQQIQKFTGVAYDVSELMLVYKLFILRKENKDDAPMTELLNQAATHLVNLNVAAATDILDDFEVITEIHEHDTAEVNLQVYPNPLVSNNLKIRVNEKFKSKPLKITVHDLAGKIIVAEEFNMASEEITISTENFEKGIYIVNLYLTGKIVATRSIVLD